MTIPSDVINIFWTMWETFCKEWENKFGDVETLFLNLQRKSVK